MRRYLAGILLVLACMLLPATRSYSQGAAAPASPAVSAAPAAASGDLTEEKPHKAGGFWEIITRAGIFGELIWLGLFACSGVCVALIIDSYLTIRPIRMAPAEVAASVKEAIEQGDLVKAMERCATVPCPLSNILTAGFNNVEEGYEAVQDAVSIAADKEAEKILARVTYLSVISNTTPMLGLIGTVQGMIFAFATLATTEAGAAQQAMLALNISHGLWATAIGLGVAVPAGIYFFFFKNKATSLILEMEGLTLDLTKALRNVEVVEA